MTYRPSTWLEALAEKLVPPAAAEHTLGDLAECSASDKEYFRNLLAVLPGAVWCQLRRRTNIVATVVIALITLFAMGAATAYFDRVFLDDARGWLRLGVPWLVWIGGGLLASAYGPRDNLAKSNYRVLAAATGAALISGAILAVPLAGVALGMGIVAGIIVVLSMPWAAGSLSGGPPTRDTLPAQARMFQKTIRWRNLRESVVALTLVVFMLDEVVAAEGPERTETLLLVAGLLFVAIYVHLVAGARRVPEGSVDVVFRFHRGELQRQRNILRSVPLWYMAPLVPGILTSLINKSDGIEIVVPLICMGGIFAFVWWLNVIAARWLDSQIRQLDALEETIR